MTVMDLVRSDLPEGPWRLKPLSGRYQGYWRVDIDGIWPKVTFFPGQEGLARAVAAVPDLLAEIDRLRVENATLKGEAVAGSSEDVQPPREVLRQAPH